MYYAVKVFRTHERLSPIKYFRYFETCRQASPFASRILEASHFGRLQFVDDVFIVRIRVIRGVESERIVGSQGFKSGLLPKRLSSGALTGGRTIGSSEALLGPKWAFLDELGGK